LKYVATETLIKATDTASTKQIHIFLLSFISLASAPIKLRNRKRKEKCKN